MACFKVLLDLYGGNEEGHEEAESGYPVSLPISETSNVVVVWLTLLLHVREVPISNLFSETGYID
jgi:hypothetical protein